MKEQSADPGVDCPPPPDKDPARPSVYLYPGQIFVASTPCAVTTILGSCVAVCLWDEEQRAGGINHYLLPHGRGDGPSALRFGNVAIEQLISKVCALGGPAPRLKAKVFGGSSMLKAPSSGGGDLGARNAEVAMSLLRHANIPVVSNDVGGERGRMLIFRMDDGSAWVRRL